MSVNSVIVVLLIVIGVVTLARRFRLPYTVGLLAAGIALGLLRSGPQIAFTKDLVFLVLLPPLVFEAAINIEWPELRRDLILVLVLATVGLAVAVIVVACGMWRLAGWPLATSLLFASLISATDPVSVIASLKEFGITGRLRLLVEAESLINDGTAAVCFGLALAFATGVSISPPAAMGYFVYAAAGGAIAGYLVGQLGLIVANRTSDYLVEVATTIAMAYGSFLLAEQMHMSGVLAALTSGLVAGNSSDRRGFSPKSQEMLQTFWEVIAFLANCLVFVLMGIRLSRVPLVSFAEPTLWAITFVLIGRAIAVYGISACFGRSRWQVPSGTQHVLFWGGLRGALALGLVLGLPEETPKLSEVLGVTFGVVAFSVVIQGLTMKPLLDRAKEE